MGKYTSFWSRSKVERREEKKRKNKFKQVSTPYQSWYDDAYEDYLKDKEKEKIQVATSPVIPYYNPYRNLYQPKEHVNTFVGYSAFSSFTNNYGYGYGYGFYQGGCDDNDIKTFSKVYKHIDDLKSILNVPNSVLLHLTRESKYTTLNCDKISIETGMFNRIKNEIEALDICMGGALIDFARYFIGPRTEEDILTDSSNLDKYIKYIGELTPGYMNMIEQYVKYKKEHSRIYKNSSRSFNLSEIYADREIANPLQNQQLCQQCEGVLNINGDVSTNIVQNNEYEYKRYFETISPYITLLTNTLNKFFVDNNIRYYGSRNGVLDSNKLVEAIQGCQNVHYNEYRRKTSQLDICVLIDESGSMSGTKIKLAKAAAILMNEVCGRINNCNLYIYGHTADEIRRGMVNIFCYKDDFNKHKYSLGKVIGRCNNQDGEAIREVVKRIRKQNKNTVLMFVLSDGQPNCQAYDFSYEVGIKDTADAVKEAEKQGFIITQCCFKGSKVSSEKMYKNYITIDNDDITEFPVKLGKFIVNNLIKNYKITES